MHMFYYGDRLARCLVQYTKTNPVLIYISLKKLQNKYPNAIECQVIDNSNTTSSSCDNGAKLEVIIVTSEFDNISNIKRHREIQNLLKEKGLFDNIHALQIKAWTVEQYSRMERKVVYEV